jgi:hypothetical protein
VAQNSVPQSRQSMAARNTRRRSNAPIAAVRSARLQKVAMAQPPSNRGWSNAASLVSGTLDLPLVYEFFAIMIPSASSVPDAITAVSAPYRVTCSADIGLGSVPATPVPHDQPDLEMVGIL